MGGNRLIVAHFFMAEPVKKIGRILLMTRRKGHVIILV